MEISLTLTDLKSSITFIHLAGLALGLGGAWILDSFLIKKMYSTISNPEIQVIKFVSKLVYAGLALLWLSGIFFIAYYYQFTPEFLQNEKVWAKGVIVLILTLNGILVHNIVISKLEQCVDKVLLVALSSKEVNSLTIVGAISFVSWLFPVVLGVSKSLNFSVSALNILSVYAIALSIAIIFASLLVTYLYKKHASSNKENLHSTEELNQRIKMIGKGQIEKVEINKAFTWEPKIETVSKLRKENNVKEVV